MQTAEVLSLLPHFDSVLRQSLCTSILVAATISRSPRWLFGHTGCNQTDGPGPTFKIHYEIAKLPSQFANSSPYTILTTDETSTLDRGGSQSPRARRRAHVHC